MQPSKNIAIILSKRDPEKYKAIIERAALNGYHDFKHDTVPGHPEYAETICPKLQLADDLSAYPELNDICRLVKQGEFDDPADEIDQEKMRGELLDDNTPDAMFKMLGLKIPTDQERQQWHLKKQLN